MTRSLVHVGLSLLSMLAIAGCADASDDDGVETPATSNDAIIGGTETYERDAVGVTTLNGDTGCSATLVRRDVILLAAHCFDPGRTDIAPWQFEIRKGDAPSQRFRFDTGEGWVKGRNYPGSEDLALVHLKQPVPANVATPIRIASAWPSWGTTLEMIGFGCTQRGGGGAGVKRKIEKTYYPSYDLGWVTQASCPGDSGGALLSAQGPALVGVISGYRGNGYDLFGDAVKYRAELYAVMARWQ